MTQSNSQMPASAKRGVVSAGGAGGSAGSWPGGSGGGFTTSLPKPKMTDEELRLECVRLAVQAKVQPSALISTAESMLAFIKPGAK
jgi:hypothetical protein